MVLSYGRYELKRFELAVPAAVASATAMKASTTVGTSASAAVKSTAVIPVKTATCIAPMVTTSDIAADRSSPVTVSGPIAISRSVAVARPIAVSRAVVAVARAAIIAAVGTVKPWSGTDKDAAYKVTRSVIAIGCACIRVVAVITVGAYRSGADSCVDGTNCNADGNLSLCMSSGKKQNPKQRNIL